MNTLLQSWKDPATGMFLRVFLLLNMVLLPLVWTHSLPNLPVLEVLLISPGLAALAVVLSGRASLSSLGMTVFPWTALLVGIGAVFFYSLTTLGLGVISGQVTFAEDWDWSRTLSWSLSNGLVFQSLCWAFGEELGWRGFLSARMTALTNERTALIYVWLLWLCWHIPAFFMMTDAGADSLLYFGLFASTLLALTVLMNTFRTVTLSVWPAVFIHSVHNQLTLELPMRSLAEEEGFLWTSEYGIGTALLSALTAVLLSLWYRSAGSSTPKRED